MRSNSDFWLTLHQLASDLEKEGSTPEERTENLLIFLKSLSPATMTVYLQNLDTVTATLAPLLLRCKEP